MSAFRSVAAIVALLCGHFPAFCQVETGRILGTVTDPSGAVIAGALVTIANTETGIQHITKSTAAGRFESLPLRVGAYRVTAEMNGFKRTVHDRIIVRIQDNVVVNVRMEVGDVAQEMQVSADAPQLETTKATQEQVIENQKIVELPLNGRSYIELAMLSTGVNPQASGARADGFSGSGMRASQNNFVLDGIDNNNNQATMDAQQGETVRPSVDAIQEFKMETNTFSAEYGRALGAVVNVTLKSGTNKLHGTFYEFLRNEDLDGRNFFSNPAAAKAPFKRNQFGFSAGGPVVRNKSFFFTDYEGSRVRESSTVNATVPTVPMVQGDFRELGVAIYDPFSYDGSTRTPFPNAVIPQARMDPISSKVARWYPAPNKAGLRQNYLYIAPAADDTNKWDVKSDHNFSPNDNIYGRFSWWRRLDYMSPTLPPPAYGGAAQEFQHDGRNAVLAYNHVFSPTLLTSTRIGWNRIYTYRYAPLDHNYNAELGLTGANNSFPGGATFGVSTFSTLGTGQYNPDPADSQTRQLINDTTWIRGRHTLKFGASLSWLQAFNYNAQQALGVFNFDGSYTRHPATRAGGNSVADLLMGTAYQETISNFVHFSWRAPYHAFYVQDEWRATRKLTLNIGLRYELRLPWVENSNRIGNFDIDSTAGKPQLVLAAEGDRYSRSTLRTDTNNFGPRFGLAHQITDKLVLRGGYGMYYSTMESFGDDRSVSGNPPFFMRAELSTDRLKPTLVVRNGFPADILTPQKANSLQFVSQDRGGALPYAQQWSFSVQRQLPSSLLVEIGYYGNTARHLMLRKQGNWAEPGPGDINSRRRFTSVRLPGSGVVVTPLSTVWRLEPSANSNFHSMQLRVEKRLSHGLNFLSTYIWSKTLSNSRGLTPAGGSASTDPQNPQNLDAEWSLADEHRAHRFVHSFGYDLPLGRGRAYLSNANRLVHALLGGWSAGGILSFLTGPVINLSVNGNPSNTGGPDRPNVVFGQDWKLPADQRTLARWFNTSAFAANAPYTFGNAGRNLLTGPGTVNLDVAVHKSFQLTERFRLQFRAEAFNSTNTPRFGNPNAQVGNPSFGLISGAGTPRNLQLGLKVLY